MPSRSGERVAVDYPPEYRAWAEREGLLDPAWAFGAKERQRPLLESWASIDVDACGADLGRGRAGSARLAIAFPDDGDIFAIDPVLRPEFQTVNLEAIVPSDVELLTWTLDGTIIARVGAPFAATWQLEAGEHGLSIEGRRSDGTVVAGERVRFTVRGSGAI